EAAVPVARVWNRRLASGPPHEHARIDGTHPTARRAHRGHRTGVRRSPPGHRIRARGVHRRRARHRPRSGRGRECGALVHPRRLERAPRDGPRGGALRIDPANTAFKVRDIAKIVGGVTSDCTRLAALLYRQIVGTVTEVSSAKVAELAKLYENVFRNVNIALANEFALMCRRLGVNVREVIEAAATKPFGFLPFYPGPGIAGRCVPLAPVSP